MIVSQVAEYKIISNRNRHAYAHIDKPVLIHYDIGQFKGFANITALKYNRIQNCAMRIQHTIISYCCVWAESHALADAGIFAYVNRRDDLRGRVKDNVSRKPHAFIRLSAS